MRPPTARRLAAALLVLGACAPEAPAVERSDAPVAVPSDPSSGQADPFALGEAFLDDHVADDGRVVRRDQGGDTVSEGQAYGMLVAVAIGDRDRFDAIWNWTQQHLMRDDGLLAWRWADGTVTDPMPASDADLDAAHALTLAADRFGDRALAADAIALSRAVLDHEVVDGSRGPVLVAGPWAVDGRWVNPSYASPVAFAALAGLTGDEEWDSLDDGGRRVVEGSTTDGDLPPDWAVLAPSAVEPRGAPDGGGRPEHGYDAARTAIRWAIDCDSAGPPLAAAMADDYHRAADREGRPPAVLTLDGDSASDHGSPVMTVAHAAAAQASGDVRVAREILDVATAQARRSPSYYGDAWVALGHLWLTTDRLGGCASGPPGG